MDELKKILEQAATPADTALVLFASALGLVLDAGLNIVGFLEPGMVGVVAGILALSLKKAADVGLAKRRERKRAGFAGPAQPRQTLGATLEP